MATTTKLTPYRTRPGRSLPGQRTRATASAILLLPDRILSVSLDAFERLLWWLFAGSAGGKTRALVIEAIRDEPRNNQQLSEALHLDYTTVRHHLKVLEQNRLVVTEGTSYGKLYFLSDAMEAHWQDLQAILDKTRKRR